MLGLFAITATVNNEDSVVSIGGVGIRLVDSTQIKRRARASAIALRRLEAYSCRSLDCKVRAMQHLPFLPQREVPYLGGPAYAGKISDYSSREMGGPQKALRE